MNGFLKWLPWLRKPTFVPGPKHVQGVPVQPQLKPYAHFFECECGRQHPEGWVCLADVGGRS